MNHLLLSSECNCSEHAYYPVSSKCNEHGNVLTPESSWYKRQLFFLRIGARNVGRVGFIVFGIGSVIAIPFTIPIALSLTGYSTAAAIISGVEAGAIVVGLFSWMVGAIERM